MRRFDIPPLAQIALKVLEDEAVRAKATPGHTWPARFALAYLGPNCRDPGPFLRFWDAMVVEPGNVRNARLDESMKLIRWHCGCVSSWL